MNFEHLSSFPNVESVSSQKEVIQLTGTQEAYGKFHDRNFHVNSIVDWKNVVAEYTDRFSDEVDEDFFKLLTLVGTLCNQYGWMQLNGHKDRHEKYGWKREFLDPRHVLALGSYVGYLNQQSIEIKSALVEQFSDNPELQAGIIGLLLRSKNGEVRRDPSLLADRDELRRYAEFRFESSRMILLPDVEVNNKFADLQFTGELAENMSDHEFQDNVLPKVEVILAEQIPGFSVEIFMNRKNMAQRFYSTPVNS